MYPPRTSHLIVSLLAVLAFSACGGGGAVSFGGGIGGSGIVFGSVTSLDPLVVDGIEIDASAAIVTIDDAEAQPSDLQRGMVVAVAGTFDEDTGSGVADSIDFASVVEGPLLAANPVAGTANVLGSPILVDADAVVSGFVLEPAAVGTIVRVSGFALADGSVRATLLEARPGSLVRALGGVISQLEADLERFQLRNLIVDYSSAVRIATPPDGLRDGQIARVLVAGPPQAGTVSAIALTTRVSRIDAAIDPIRVEGIVTTISSASRFVLNDQIPVELTRRTEFIGGSADDVRVGARARVTGLVRDDRVLSARRVAFPSGP